MFNYRIARLHLHGQIREKILLAFLYGLNIKGKKISFYCPSRPYLMTLNSANCSKTIWCLKKDKLKTRWPNLAIDSLYLFLPFSGRIIKTLLNDIFPCRAWKGLQRREWKVEIHDSVLYSPGFCILTESQDHKGEELDVSFRRQHCGHSILSPTLFSIITSSVVLQP